MKNEETEKPALRDLVELQVNWDPHAGGRSHGRLQPLRRVPRPIVADANVPHLPPPAAEEASPRAKANMIRGILTE